MPRPVPQDMMRVRLRATLGISGAPVEEAQFGFYGQLRHFSGNLTDWAENVQTVADGVRDRWVEHITGIAYWSEAVVMDSVKVDHLEAATGKTIDQGVALFTGDDAWAGFSGASLPWETAAAVSLFNYPRGVFTPEKSRKRGRFYLPPFATAVISDRSGEIGSTAINEISTQVGAFLNDVQGIELGGSGPSGNNDYFNLVIMSIGTPLKPLPPTTYDVNYMYLDSKIDSQRRRERQQDARTVTTVEIAHA